MESGQANAHCDAGNSEAARAAASQPLAPVLSKLRRTHYDFFMANPRFWYERDLREADAIIVRAASELRAT